MRFFCWQSRRIYLEEQLRRPSRAISASVAAWGRTQSDLPSEEVLARTAAQMDRVAAMELRANYEWLQALFQKQPARNDRAWILTTGNQYSPSKATAAAAPLATCGPSTPRPTIRRIGPGGGGHHVQHGLGALVPGLPHGLLALARPAGAAIFPAMVPGARTGPTSGFAGARGRLFGPPGDR